MDGEALSFEQEFDAVFSNAVLHWMTRSARVAAGAWRALKPGGRFVAEFGGHGNVATIVAAIEAGLAARGVAIAAPWYFPHPEEYQRRLEENGFTVERLELIPRPTPLPGDVGSWLRTFAQIYLLALPEAAREDFIAQLVDALRSSLRSASGGLYSDYVRLRVAA